MTLDVKDKSLKEVLMVIPDPRKERGIRYKYFDLLLMAIYAILSGYGCSVDISYYVELNFEYFSNLLGLKRVPSHDTFSRIIRMTDFDYLSTTLEQWLAVHYPSIFKRFEGKKVLHVDGKCVHAAAEISNGENPIYLLNAMYEGGTISLYTKQIGEKENETGQIVNFLSGIDITDTIITIDAAGTTDPILNYICSRKGYYLVPVKKNQPQLFESITRHVEELENSGEFEELQRAEQSNRGHGRTEVIRTTMIKNTEFIFKELGLNSFYGSIARVGVMDKIVSQKIRGELQKSVKRTFLITNLEEISVANMQAIKLSHWNIEMEHWILDVQINEDRDTSRKDNAIKNNTVLKRFCMHIKKKCGRDDLTLNKFFMGNMRTIESITEMLAAQVG